MGWDISQTTRNARAPGGANKTVVDEDGDNLIDLMVKMSDTFKVPAKIKIFSHSWQFSYMFFDL